MGMQQQVHVRKSPPYPYAVVCVIIVYVLPFFFLSLILFSYAFIRLLFVRSSSMSLENGWLYKFNILL